MREGLFYFRYEKYTATFPIRVENRVYLWFQCSVWNFLYCSRKQDVKCYGYNVVAWKDHFLRSQKKKAKCKLLFSLVLKFPGFKMGIATFFQSYYYFICVHAQLCPVLCDSMEFSRQEYWSGLPFPSPGDCPDPGMEPVSLASSALAGGFFTTGTTWEHYRWQVRCVLRSGRFSDKNLKSHFHNQSCSN